VSDKDPFENHNGGCIGFGPDGFLYIALGDSGAAGDPLKTGQNPTDWWASILRIDVDHPSGGKAYGIPADNPARRSKAFAHWAPEVFSIGLRNVWKFSFDRSNGTLWAGDVGQNEWEEVDVLPAGQGGLDFGWSVMEGPGCYESTSCDTAALLRAAFTSAAQFSPVEPGCNPDQTLTTPVSPPNAKVTRYPLSAVLRHTPAAGGELSCRVVPGDRSGRPVAP
jgi:glucose/arabinose dehydrogenase